MKKGKIFTNCLFSIWTLSVILSFASCSSEGDSISIIDERVPLETEAPFSVILKAYSENSDRQLSHSTQKYRRRLQVMLHLLPAVQQILSSHSLRSSRMIQLYSSTSSRMRMCFHMHYSQQLLLSSSSIEKHSRRRLTLLRLIQRIRHIQFNSQWYDLFFPQNPQQLVVLSEKMGVGRQSHAHFCHFMTDWDI